MKTLILMTAVPGAGKSTWAREFQANNPNTFIISSDEIRQELLGHVQNFTNEELVWSTFRERIHQYASMYEDVNVILDAVNYSNKGRLFYYEESKEYDKHILVYVKKPLEVLLEQNKKRDQNRWVPDDVVVNFFNKFEEPNDEVKAKFEVLIVE
jgi:tRNA uridine 5-carbamoylmethylation protein Kti12